MGKQTKSSDTYWAMWGSSFHSADVVLPHFQAARGPHTSCDCATQRSALGQGYHPGPCSVPSDTNGHLSARIEWKGGEALRNKVRFTTQRVKENSRRPEGKTSNTCWVTPGWPRDSPAAQDQAQRDDPKIVAEAFLSLRKSRKMKKCVKVSSDFQWFRVISNVFQVQRSSETPWFPRTLAKDKASPWWLVPDWLDHSGNHPPTSPGWWLTYPSEKYQSMGRMTSHLLWKIIQIIQTSMNQSHNRILNALRHCQSEVSSMSKPQIHL